MWEVDIFRCVVKQLWFTLALLNCRVLGKKNQFKQVLGWSVYEIKGFVLETY